VLPRERRVHPRSQVRLTIRRGRRVRSGALVLHHLDDGDSPRAAVVVARGSGSAVVRHRRQRQVRHALAELWEQLPTGNLVIRALPGVEDYPRLLTDLQQAVARL